MWQVVDTVVRKIGWFILDGLRSNIEKLNMRETKHQSVMKSDDSDSNEDDSGFADDERLPSVDDDLTRYSNQPLYCVQSDEDSSENENDFVLDADVKRQQRMTLLSLLYSRALEKRINRTKRMKGSYSITNAKR